MKTTEENNALIARFMGMQKGHPDKNETRWKNDWFENLDVNGNVFESGARHSEPLGFNRSWDWLMPVLEKIEYMLHDDIVVTIQYKTCYIPVVAGTFSIKEEDADGFDIEGTGNTKLEACYNAICEFIEWYNENKKL